MNTQTANSYYDREVVDRDTRDRSSSRFSVDSIMESFRNFATVSEALRIVGAAVLLSSMSMFLLQGWNEGNDINRYLMLLAQTGLLAGAGFAMSHGLGEAKGARVFFGLALVSIPANFTILGALLYSVIQWDGGLTTYPSFASWQIDDITRLGLTVGGAMAVLLPATLFCFAIMARQSSKALSLHFVLLNLLLLLPIRSSLAAGSIALAGTIYALYIVSRLVRQDPALKTGEGKFALTTLFIPAGIILFRSMYLYQVDSLMIAMLSTALLLAARQAATFPGRNPRVAMVLDVLSLPIILAAALSTTDAFSPILASTLHAPMFAAIYTGLALDIMRRTDSRALARLTGMTISLFVSLSFVLSVVFDQGALTALLSIFAGIAMLLAGASLNRLSAVFAGAIMMLAGVLLGLEPIIDFVVGSDWVDLAIFGAGAIALGSVLDRHGVAIKLRLSNWVGTLSEGNRTTAIDNQ